MDHPTWGHSAARRVWSALACALGITASAIGAQDAPSKDDAPEARYMRISDEDDGAIVRLDLSIRTLEPADAGGPTVHLVGAAHIAQPAYYRELQAFLDEQDIVLYEGVGPEWMNLTEDASDERRAQITRARIRFVASAAERVRRSMSAYPETAEALLEKADRSAKRQIADAMVDGWGDQLRYAIENGELSLVSLGADGLEGGEDTDEDLRWSDQPPLEPGELAEPDGLQSQMADAAGLVFQLDSIDYLREGWINADMTVDELLGMSALGAEGEDGETDPFLSLLSGESFMAKVVGVVLKLVGSSEYSRAIMRLMLIEMLGRAEELMELAMPAAMGDSDFAELIVDGRNEVVLEDLRAVLDAGTDAESIAIFYGAGHLPGLESSLIESGYRVTDTTWIPAITVDFASSGIPARDGKRYRSMVSRMLDQQIRAARRMARPAD